MSTKEKTESRASSGAVFVLLVGCFLKKGCFGFRFIKIFKSNLARAVIFYLKIFLRSSRIKYFERK